MRLEEIALRQEIRQMLNEAGINKNTLKDTVNEVLTETIERATVQALHERDLDSAVGSTIQRCIDNSARSIVREEIRKRVGNIFNRMTVSVEITDNDGQEVTTVR